MMIVTTVTTSSQALKLRYFENKTHRPTVTCIAENKKMKIKATTKMMMTTMAMLVMIKTNESKGGPTMTMGMTMMPMMVTMTRMTMMKWN